MRPMLSCPSFSLSFSLLVFVLSWSCFTSCNIMVSLFGQLTAMCPKPKHLVLEVLMGDLWVEVEGLCLETLWGEMC